MRLAGSICRPLVRRWSEVLKPEKSVKGLKDSHVGGPTTFLGLKLLSKCSVNFAADSRPNCTV